MMEFIQDIPYYEDDMPLDHDTAYAKERCLLDIHTPDRSASLPVVVFFHGGGMTGGSKSCPDTLWASGNIVAVTPNYRLSSDRAKCPDYLYDAAAAVAWTFRHIAEYGGDPKKITLSGGSAGGYLAAMLGMDSRWLSRFGCDNQALFLIAPISGQMTTHFQILNERLGTCQNIPDHAVIDDFAPIWHAAQTLPPIALYTGDVNLDWPSRPQENMLLDATLRNIKGHPAASCTCLPGFSHGDIYSPACTLLVKKIAAMTAENA